MSISLQDLKKASKSNLDHLIKESEKLSGAKEKKTDDRYWSPTLDSSGNFTGLIRFLPAPKVDGLDGLPWAMYFDHGFQGPSGKWYIEKSLTSIKKADPLAEYNSKLWATGDKELIDQARKQKRRQIYVSNILVLNDPAKPENNGKVFLYSYGKKIFEKIKNVMTPDEELGEEPNDPFDFWSGQNFKLKIKQVSGFRNYDDSAFSNPSAVFDGNDDKIAEVWAREYSLKDFTDPANYKAYDDLKKRLYDVLEIRDESAPSSSAMKMAESAEKSFDKDHGLDKIVEQTSTEEDEDLEALLKEFD